MKADHWCRTASSAPREHQVRSVETAVEAGESGHGGEGHGDDRTVSGEVLGKSYTRMPFFLVCEE